jgi:hypothetical protein
LINGHNDPLPKSDQKHKNAHSLFSLAKASNMLTSILNVASLAVLSHIIVGVVAIYLVVQAGEPPLPYQARTLVSSGRLPVFGLFPWWG